MLSRAFVLSVALAMTVVCSTGLFAQINITNGTSTYTWDANTGTGSYTGPSYANNILVEEKWVVRLEDHFNPTNPVGFQELTPGENVSILNATNSLIRFNVETPAGDPGLEIQLDFSMDANGGVEFMVDILDENFVGSTNTISLFNYFDMDLDGTNSGTASATDIVLTGDSGESFTKTAVDADAFQVSNPIDLVAELTNDINFNLNNNGLLSNSNVAGAFQWNHTLSSGGTYGGAGGSFGGAGAIPEPSSLGIGLLALGLIGLGRRSRRA